MSPGTIKHSWVLHVKRLKFLPDFNQIWIFSTDFHGASQYQMSRKSVQWEPRRHVPTEGQTKSTFPDYTNAPKNYTNIFDT
jgi:hypothetical protein